MSRISTRKEFHLPTIMQELRDDELIADTYYTYSPADEDEAIEEITTRVAEAIRRKLEAQKLYE